MFDEGKVYLSGALASAPNLAERCQLYEDFRDLAAKEGLNIFLPHTRTHPVHNPGLRPLTVYQRDLQAIRESNLVLAFLDVASLGVGAEVAAACSLQIPVLGCAPSNSLSSRYLQGLLEACETGWYMEYNELFELVEHAKQMLKSILRHRHHHRIDSVDDELLVSSAAP